MAPASDTPARDTQRLLLAVVAALLTAGGVFLLLVHPTWASAGLDSILLRSGLVLGALALALPQVRRMLELAPPWFLACLLLGLLVIIRWPKSAGVVVPLLVVLWLLGPRRKAQPPAAGRPRRKVRKQKT